MDKDEYEQKLQRRKAMVSSGKRAAAKDANAFAWHFLPGLVLGIGVGWALNLLSSRSSQQEAEARKSNKPAQARVAAPSEPMKMVFLVNDELKMTKGKIAAQCGHAVYGLAKKLQQSNPALLKQWESCGQAKIALRANGGVPQMRELAKQAAAHNIPAHAVFDAGRTQIAAGSQTVIALGPAGKSLLDSITGHLKLL